jgi:radical SAM superfamily enzyme YgiQ (UPF0313 family)
MALRVYLGDLRYNYSGVLANDCMPLGVAYIKAVMDREDTDGAVDSRIFVYPDRLLEAMRENPPDVIMLSNYVWNEALSQQFFSIAKSMNPNTLTVMGGPNICLEPERQKAYLSAHPDLDVYLLGEADFSGWYLLRDFLDCGRSIAQLGDREIASATYRNSQGEVVINLTKPRHKQVETIPSPWLTGIQDEFFDGRLAPMIETNRGCPFTCTYCCQGTNFYTKVHNFDVARMKEEIEYIAKRIHEKSPQMGTLRIADSNYGMYERDIEISGHIGAMQRKYGWPTFIDATTGKNRPERIIKSVEQVSGALVLYQAVQSLDEDVLRKVKRSTISLDAYKQLEIHMRGRGLRSVSDLILGLPGESLETHMKGLKILLDSNIHQMHNFQAMMLKGSEMETLESRREFRFETRFRVLPKNFGVYGGCKVFDTEEIVVATDTLPFNDYITARTWHLASSVFWNDGWFERVVRFTRSQDIPNSDWWSLMVPAMENGGHVMRGFLDSFIAETIGELFPTREACIEHYSRPENFKKLENGEAGDNLMYRYRAIASFHIWNSVCRTAMEATRTLLLERGVGERIADFDNFWDDFSTYTELQHASGHTVEEVLSPAHATLRYDIAGWLAAGPGTDPSFFRLSEPAEFEFRLSPEGRKELADSLAVWTTHVKGLTKLVTRIRIESQIRECVQLSNPVLGMRSWASL